EGSSAQPDHRPGGWPDRNNRPGAANDLISRREFSVRGPREDRIAMKRLMLLVVLGIVAVNLSRCARSGTPRSSHRIASARVVSVTVDDSTSSREDAGALESVDGLPVPIVPGTRVTEAEIRPPKAPRTPRRPSTTLKKAAAQLPSDHRVVAGLL